MNTPMLDGIKKEADIEDRGQWYWHPELEAMREELENKGTFDTKKYRLKTISELDKTLAEEKAERAERIKSPEYKKQMGRASAGEKQTSGEVRKSAFGYAMAGSASGALAGGLLSLPVRLLGGHSRIVPLMAAGGAVAGGAGMGIYRLLKGKKKIDAPDDYSGGIKELEMIRSQFSKPYVQGKPHALRDWLEGYDNADSIKSGSAKSMSPALQVALLAGGAGLATIGGVYMGMSKRDKKRVGRELRDPRLYSNLSGMVRFKSKKDIKSAHKKLGKGDGTILGAIRSGVK